MFAGLCYDDERKFVSKLDGRVGGDAVRGKSEHRRAECRVTPGGGDSKESATERYRRVLAR